MESAKDHLINDKVMSEGVSLHIINQIFFAWVHLGYKLQLAQSPFVILCDWKCTLSC